jgi:hypothetical protein
MPSLSFFKNHPRAPKLFSVLLGTAMLSPTSSLAHCIEKLQGQSYVSLPEGICPQYSDVLFDRLPHQPEYGGVICDQPKESYILLQKLLKYTQQGKAVWQVVRIKKVVKPKPQSFVMEVGCKLKQLVQKDEPVLALVDPHPAGTLSAIAAWKINLTDISFVELDPRQVICQSLTL